MQAKLTRTIHIRLEKAMERYLTRSMPSECLTDAWTGLGYVSDYRSVVDAGLMEWVHGWPPPRCMGWLRLTEAGAEIVASWLEEHNENRE